MEITPPASTIGPKSGARSTSSSPGQARSENAMSATPMRPTLYHENVIQNNTSNINCRKCSMVLPPLTLVALLCPPRGLSYQVTIMETGPMPVTNRKENPATENSDHELRHCNGSVIQVIRFVPEFRIAIQQNTEHARYAPEEDSLKQPEVSIDQSGKQRDCYILPLWTLGKLHGYPRVKVGKPVTSKELKTKRAKSQR